MWLDQLEGPISNNENSRECALFFITFQSVNFHVESGPFILITTLIPLRNAMELML